MHTEIGGGTKLAVPRFPEYQAATHDVPGQGPQHNISEISKMLLRPILDAADRAGRKRPPCRVALLLVDHVNKLRQAVANRLSGTDTGTQPGRKRLRREIRLLRERLEGYKKALAGCKPKDDIPKSVEPLFYVVEGVGHFTPDALTPFEIDNQISAFEAHYIELQDSIVPTIMEAVLQLPSTIWEVVKKGVVIIKEDIIDPLTPSSLPWVIGGLVGLGVVGGAVYLSRR